MTASSTTPSKDQVDAELWRLAVRKGLITVHSERMVETDHGTRCSWIQGYDKAVDISNEAADITRHMKAAQ